MTFGIGPGGHRQDLPGRRDGRRRAARASEVNRVILDAPGRRGRRAPGLPARRPDGQDRSVPAPAVRRAARHAGPREGRRGSWTKGVIEVAPLAFMRGRTLNDSFVILDEAQNTTPEQMKMFLTRLGFGSRMVVTGDITQVDLPREQTVGPDRRRRRPVRGRGRRLRPLRRRDVVRHQLVQRIVEAYDTHDEAPGVRAGAPRPRRRSRRRGCSRSRCSSASGGRASGPSGAGRDRPADRARGRERRRRTTATSRWRS